MTNHPIVPLERSRRDQAAGLLARAFQGDPLFRYAIPQDDKRAKVLTWLLGRVLVYASLYGEVHTTPALRGVVCWVAPGKNKLTPYRVLRTGLTPITVRFGLAAYRRFDINQAYVYKMHTQHAPKDHWYLWAIGVDPASQGKGIGSALMKPVLTKASASGTPCYLETHNTRNVRFYEKHGFRVVSEGDVPKGGPHVWALVRD